MVFILVVFPQVKNSYTKQLALLALFFRKNVSNLNQVRKKYGVFIFFISNLKFINNFYFLFWPHKDRTS